MEGIKTHTKIGKIPGQADSFKVCIESPLGDVIVGQGIYDFLRDMFSLCKVNDLYLAAIDRIAEEQNLKVRRLRVFVNAALIQIDVGEGFDIYTDVFQSDHLNSNRRQRLLPAACRLFVLRFHALLVVLESRAACSSHAVHVPRHTCGRAVDSTSRFSRLRSLKKLWIAVIRITMLKTSQIAIRQLPRIV
jgi:hypothetical protein